MKKESAEKGETGEKGERGEKGDKGDKGDDASVDLTPYARTEYVDGAIYDAMHRSRSVRKLNTHQRNFTDSNWNYYGSAGHVEDWSSTTNYAEFTVGDLGILYGKSTTTGKYVALIGEVTAVSSSLQMRTLACYQTDEYMELTEYGIDLAEDLQVLQDEVAGKADKSEIPDISGKADISHTHSELTPIASKNMKE